MQKIHVLYRGLCLIMKLRIDHHTQFAGTFKYITWLIYRGNKESNTSSTRKLVSSKHNASTGHLSQQRWNSSTSYYCPPICFRCCYLMNPGVCTEYTNFCWSTCWRSRIIRMCKKDTIGRKDVKMNTAKREDVGKLR